MPLTDEECPHCDDPVHTDGLIDGVHHLGCGRLLHTASEWLAERTGKPIEEFEPDFEENPIPEFAEQEWEDIDGSESPFAEGVEDVENEQGGDGEA